MRLLAPLVIALTLAAGSVWAQPTAPRGGLLVVDQEQLFATSAYGRRVLADIEQATRDLVNENRTIEETLIAEERELTDLRPTLSSEEFRALADAFDEKVQRIRAEQEAKSDAVGSSLEDARRDFFQSVIPILAEIMRDERAVAIMEKRSVLLSLNLIDVTDRAVALIDERIGDGSDAETSPAPSDQ